MLFWISCLLAAVSLHCVVWIMTGPLRGANHGRPAGQHVLIKLAWPWIHAASLACAPFLTWGARRTLESRLRLAGLGGQWKPEHIAGMQVVGFGLGAGVPSLVVLMDVPIGATEVVAAVLAMLAGGWWPRHWVHSQGLARQRMMLREFPFLLDMATLCVEAGLNLQGALQQAAEHGPAGPLRDELRYALADIRAGVVRLVALQQLADRTALPSVQQLVMSLAQADQLGMSLGPLLRAQSEQHRTERFLRAEKLALEAPVKMLVPMVCCIFPCTFLIIGFPIAIKLMDWGLQ